MGSNPTAPTISLLLLLACFASLSHSCLRRMVFNVAAANCDDHTKNFSFLLREGRAWELSPAYDVTHAHAPDSRWTRQHLMAVNGQTTNIALSDVRTVGERFGVPGVGSIVGQVLDAVARWPALAAEAGVAQETTDKVASHIETWSSPLRGVRRRAVSG